MSNKLIKLIMKKLSPVTDYLELALATAYF